MKGKMIRRSCSFSLPACLVAFGLLVASAAVAVPACADNIIFNNLGAGDSFDGGSAWAVSGTTSAFVNLGIPSESIGKSFTPSADLDLSQVLIPLRYSSGTNGMNVYLESSNNGLPGAPLESWSVTGLSMNGTLEDLSASGVLLSGGTTYWIVAAPMASDTAGGWMFNNTGDSDLAFNNGSGWFAGLTLTSPALKVTGTPVPEPAMFFLLCCGLIAVFLFRIGQTRGTGAAKPPLSSVYPQRHHPGELRT